MFLTLRFAKIKELAKVANFLLKHLLFLRFTALENYNRVCFYSAHKYNLFGSNINLFEPYFCF